MSKSHSFTLSLLNRKIAFSTLIQYGGKALQIVISSFALKIISNYLSDSGYSLYAAITEFALFFSVLGNLGIFGNLVRQMSEQPDNSKLFSQTIILRAVTGLLLFILAMLTLLILRSDPVFILGTALFLGALLFDYLTSVCDAMLQANYLMGRATLALVLGRLTNTALLFFVVKNLPAEAPLLESLGVILTCTLFGSLITALLSLFFVRQKLKFTWQWDSTYLLKLFYVGLPFGLINLFYSLYTRFLPDYFAHHQLNEAAFSSFNVSFRISQVLSLASTFLMFSVLPGLKQYIAEKHWQKAIKLFKEILWIILAGALLLVVGGAFAGPIIIPILTHQKFVLNQFWFVLPLMLLIAAISYLYDLVLITLFAFDDEKWFLKQEIIAFFIALLISLTTFLPIGDPTWKVLIILLSALVAEIYVVLRGYLRLKIHLSKILAKN